MRILENLGPLWKSPKTQFEFGPFNSFGFQKRWKKPADTAQTRLQDRTIDLKLDNLVFHLKKMKTILEIKNLMDTRKHGPFVSLQLMSRWRNILGFKDVGIGEFIHKYPHIFKVFTHPVRRNLCCRITQRMRDLVREEERVIIEGESDAVTRLKKLLMMSKHGRLHVHALRLIRRELGLPEDFRDSILANHTSDFRLVDLETVELVDRDEELGAAEIEKWRENEYTVKWLSEFETRHAFPINFPTGFKIEAGIREKLRNWQRLPYIKPYEKKDVVRVRSCGGIERYEKRVVAIIHELLSLTMEKMVEVERLAHFRKDFGMEMVVRELLLKHPGIFYISTKGKTQIVILREAYRKGDLVEPNPIYSVRKEMLDLMLLGCRNTRELKGKERSVEGNAVDKKSLCCNVDGQAREGAWVIPLLEGSQGGVGANIDDASDSRSAY